MPIFKLCMCIDPTDDHYSIPIIAGAVGGGVAVIVGVTVAGLCVVWLQKRKKSSIQSKEHMCIACL